MPYEFFLEMLYPLPLRHKKMFGVDAYYIREKIVFALCQKEHMHQDNGIWIASKKKHHQKLNHQVKGLRSIKSYGIKTWLLLPEDFDYFEEQANIVADLIKNNSEIIGNVPKPKR
ncbi:hypothetical protein [Costertonia aggregata]|uniref:Uncharacterized protein n=1 Tax=Costertonia aggregata TaxID=343403 RepID=A0A7H9AQU1_9FLAO|nr:hypothetical protein [Costertonia aggregata]QLG45782.1 hypothetical protein HYG79_10615 [Costertonia aggregata]